ncbi:HAD-superfamily phosphatase, subfamily IIIC/FkbH-like domain-containing protein [Algibacter lectus]|uniref:HAD-IIIC family phosphatase n=1 Tax=Algibacter lectus TaxID=221126 RepID=UPI0008E36F0C|nr:HAD-IIIC family phosphatase [Algibacter lectus]SFC35350.1 HAD-superfamily phosphatase, subfamily IIIC/FkbH-like domain-containing protein [Algibacter lectus]
MESSLSFRELNKKAKTYKTPETTIRIAVLGNHTTTFFSKSLANSLKIANFDPEIFESDYDQIDITIIDNESKLYKFNPEIIILFESTLKIKDNFYSLSENSSRSNFNLDVQNSVQNRISILRANGCQAKIINFSYELIDDNLYGNLFSKASHSFYNQLWKINNNLIDISQNTDDFFIFDVNKYLKDSNDYRDWPSYINSDLHYSIDTFAKFSQGVATFIKAIKGSFNKCLILDLDNTTWGGIIGDDGIENIQIGSLGIGKAFTKLQKWAKELKNRGIILAICSKNTENIAKDPFINHEEMVLRLDDISVFVANWKNKADNIRYIKDVLNIGLDSMVFIDDNPAERDIVRQVLPEVKVPELPEDPALYLPFLSSLNLFETASYSENDKDRTSQYQQEAERKKLVNTVTNMDDYLKSLEMVGEITDFQIDDIPRLAQLTQRSNQFNLRTKRYGENDISNMVESKNHITFSVKLKDKFGDYGLISLIILERKNENTFFIDTWLMSCRVLKRQVEYYAMNKLVDELKKINCEFILGEYLETPKNNLVADLLDKLSFDKDIKNNNQYKLNLENFKTFKNYIS